jgi:hypothetical protein
VKPYYAEDPLVTSQDDTVPNITITVDYPEEDTVTVDNTEEDTITVDHIKEDTITVDHHTKQGHGRLKGSKNKQYLTALKSFLLAKEKGDLELSLKLRQDRIISNLGLPFQASDKKEINSLLTRGVFAFEQFNDFKHGGEQIFKSRIVREIKGKATPTSFEKSRLVIQAYNNHGKEVILTQSPTIQRASQRLIIALAPTLIKLGMTI